jgi:hypothetical protein
MLKTILSIEGYVFLLLESVSYLKVGYSHDILSCFGFSCSSSGSIVSDYGLDDRGSIPDRGRGFFFQTGSGAHPNSCTMGTGGPFPGGKARPGRDADHSPPSSAEVKNE